MNKEYRLTEKKRFEAFRRDRLCDECTENARGNKNWQVLCEVCADENLDDMARNEALPKKPAGRPKKAPRTAKQKKMTKIVAEVDKRDRDPNDKRSDTAIIRQAGYAATTKPSEVFGSIAFLEAHELFYKDNKTTDEVAQQSAAKARRNILRGLDNEDDKIQLDWTKLQLKLEETTENKTKLKVVVNGSMLELMGSAAKEHLALNSSPMNGAFELGEVPDVKGEVFAGASKNSIQEEEINVLDSNGLDGE